MPPGIDLNILASLVKANAMSLVKANAMSLVKANFKLYKHHYNLKIGRN